MTQLIEKHNVEVSMYTVEFEGLKSIGFEILFKILLIIQIRTIHNTYVQ